MLEPQQFLRKYVYLKCRKSQQYNAYDTEYIKKHFEMRFGLASASTGFNTPGYLSATFYLCFIYLEVVRTIDKITVTCTYITSMKIDFLS